MERVKHFNPNTVEQAESARNQGRLRDATQLTGDALKGLTEQDLKRIAENPEQLSILACLARIQVDTLKTLANRQMLPNKTLQFVLSATETIARIYRNPDIYQALESLNLDHQGRTHYFSIEMKRDEAKVMFAATPLFRRVDGLTLITRGEQLLQQTYDLLPDDNSVKPLIGIELALSRQTRGEQIDYNHLMTMFNNLRLMNPDNPHRIATVASWLIARGIQEPQDIFNNIIQNHPEWGHLISEEKKKLLLQKLRDFVFLITTPFVTNQSQRKELLRSLIHIENER